MGVTALVRLREFSMVMCTVFGLDIPSERTAQQAGAQKQDENEIRLSFTSIYLISYHRLLHCGIINNDFYFRFVDFRIMIFTF